MTIGQKFCGCLPHEEGGIVLACAFLLGYLIMLVTNKIKFTNDKSITEDLVSPVINFIKSLLLIWGILEVSMDSEQTIISKSTIRRIHNVLFFV